MKSEPLISVVIPTYNSAQFLGETIDSILSQSYRNFEIVIVDDGSTDDSRGIIGKFDGARIRYIYQENSGGPSRPRNVGIAHASGELVSLFDSDDVMAPGKLESAAAVFLKEPAVEFLFSNFDVVDEKGAVINGDFLGSYRSFRKLLSPIAGLGDGYLMSGDVYHELLVANFIGTPSVVFRRELFEEIGCFDETLRCAEDIDFWYRVARAGKKIAFLDQVSFSYRRRASSITASSAGNIQNILTVLDRQRNSTTVAHHIKQANDQIYRVLLTDAWSSFNKKEFRLARSKYRKLLSHRITFHGLKGQFLSGLMQLVASRV